MKNILKQEKGVSLVSLGVAIIIMMIITGMLIYNTKDTAQVSKLTKMHDDIANLRDKISAYYATYGKVPAYTNLPVKLSKDAERLVGENDIGEFYIIDLKALDGITLNYGNDYDDVKSGVQDNDEDKYADIGEDIYVINEASHNIFYLKGILIDDVNYYTNYVESEKDNIKVDLRYVDGVKIPEGYYYIGKDDNGSIVISQVQNETVDYNNENQYKWTKEDIQVDDNYTLNGDYTDELKSTFDISFDEKNGYFQSLTDSKILLFEKVENTWSPVYNKEGTYTDEDGYTAYIPAGFCVSTRPSMSKVKKGLVIKNNTTSDEYVWIEVPKYITEDCVTTKQIEETLQNYVSDYRKSSYEDIGYDGCYINGNNSLNDPKNGYNNLKDAMLESIKLNGGFYIGRYEVGKTNEQVTIQAEQTIYTAKIKEAQAIVEDINSNYNSSLMFGIQWDLVCKFIQTNANLTKSAITTDSSAWGNYSEEKTTTGAKQILNIYDIADNNSELTLEYDENSVENNDDMPVVARGGTTDNPNVCYRQSIKNGTESAFRVTLFK